MEFARTGMSDASDSSGPASSSRTRQPDEDQLLDWSYSKSFLIFWSNNSTDLSFLLLYCHIKRQTEQGIIWFEMDLTLLRADLPQQHQQSPHLVTNMILLLKPLKYFSNISSAQITYDNEVVMPPDPPHICNSVFRIARCRTIELYQLWGEIIRLVSKTRSW